MLCGLPSVVSLKEPMTELDPNSLLNPHIAGISEYSPILPLDVLSERLGIAVEKLVKLDANENPYGPVEAVREALANYEHYHIYPDPQQDELRQALALNMGVDTANVLVGQGADELLDYLCRLFLSPGDAIVNTPPTFGMYSFDAKLQGADVIDVARDAEHNIDPQAVRAAVEARADSDHPVKLVFLTSPNNPTGNWMNDDVLIDMLSLPTMIVLDEAYVEFADAKSRADWVGRYSNLVVLRTFSKAAGIAGLRLGYGVFPDWLMSTLWKYKQPYNVNVAASIAGLASLANPDQVKAVIEKLKAERQRLYDLLDEIDFIEAVPGSQANYVLCKVLGRSALEVKKALENQGILVRHYAKAELENYIRISIGRPAQTDTLVDALKAL